MTWENALRDAGEAERAAADIDNPESRAQALTGLVDAWAWAGQLDDARRVAGEAERVVADIGDPWSRAEALTGLVDALAGAGQLDDAQRAAADIDNPRSRAQALTTIALKLSQTGDLTQAARIIAAAWTLSEWTTPLPVLAAIRPSALTALGRMEARASARSFAPVWRRCRGCAALSRMTARPSWSGPRCCCRRARVRRCSGIPRRA